tara:strand:- start:360 stop:707 length:348 start_codon:yes stop_codon:yes gene_type:complete
MTDVTVFFTGYNQITQGYGRGGYNQDVAFTGLTSGLGTATALAGTIVSVSGIELTASLGGISISAGGGETVQVNGLAATGGISSLNVWSGITPDQTPSWSTITASQTPNWEEIAA